MKSIIISIIFSVIFEDSFSQSKAIDTVAFKVDFEKLLLKYGVKSAGYNFVISQHQTGGQTAFVINNKYYVDSLTNKLILSKLNAAFLEATFNNLEQLKFIDSIESGINPLNNVASIFMERIRANYIYWYGYKKETNPLAEYQKDFPETLKFSAYEMKNYLIQKILSETESDKLTNHFQALLPLIGNTIKLFEFQKLKELNGSTK